MNTQNALLMTIPAPCGLAISSVTSDCEYLYALQPDRSTVYKLDVCGRILCVFRTSRRYNSIHFCADGRFYATASGDRTRIYVLNKCFSETGFFEPDIGTDTVGDSTCPCNCTMPEALFVGPAGDCKDCNCMLTIANLHAVYAASPSGRILSRLGSAGRRLRYTAVAENDGILYEGLESSVSSQTFVRATYLATGQSKIQRLPFGYRVRSFFCHGGRLYVFITRNSYHGYVAAVCTFVMNGMLGGEIIGLPDNSNDIDCCEESCDFGGSKSRCSCSSSGCTTCGGVSSNQTEMCNNAVSGDSTDTEECDTEQICRIIKCLKKLCNSNLSCSSCGTNVGGTSQCGGCHCHTDGIASEFCTAADSDCCQNGTLSCTCFRRCRCNENDVGGDNSSCLPLPICPSPCEPCNTSPTDTGCVKCNDKDLRITYGRKK